MKNKKQQLQQLKNERGLTLVELLAVIVILGIIGTIAFVSIGNVIENSKKDAHIANAQQLISSAKLYEASTGEEIGTTGVTGDTLVTAGVIEPIIDPWEKDAITMSGASVTVNADGNYVVTVPADDPANQISGKTEDDLRNQTREQIFGAPAADPNNP